MEKTNHELVGKVVSDKNDNLQKRPTIWKKS